jgi:hypothetical protein
MSLRIEALIEAINVELEAGNFQRCNADVTHQQMAGLASWAAFSARWRARQGLPLLHPMDVQYLTPQDFRNQLGQPLPPTVQRRLFRQYVEQALALAGTHEPHRRPSSGGVDLAFVRLQGVRRSFAWQSDYLYGRADLGPYDLEAYVPARPYGIPVTSEAFGTYWLASHAGDEDDNGDEPWIAECRGDEQDVRMDVLAVCHDNEEWMDGNHDGTW